MYNHMLQAFDRGSYDIRYFLFLKSGSDQQIINQNLNMHVGLVENTKCTAHNILIELLNLLDPILYLI